MELIIDHENAEIMWQFSLRLASGACGCWKVGLTSAVLRQSDEDAQKFVGEFIRDLEISEVFKKSDGMVRYKLRRLHRHCVQNTNSQQITVGLRMTDKVVMYNARSDVRMVSMRRSVST